MRIPRIYQEVPLALNDHVQLDSVTSHYVTRVLRLQKDSSVMLFNGQGGEYLGCLTHIDAKKSIIILTEFFAKDKQSPLQIELGQVISKGKRMDYVIQKATELGVTRLTPLLTKYCDVKLDEEKRQKRLQHWQQIAINACQQCGRNQLPIINPVAEMNHWLHSQTADCKLILNPGNANGISNQLVPSTVSLLIGPEGGFNHQEVGQAQLAGFAPLSLGPRILRTETAPVVGLTLLQYMWGDLS